MSKWDKINLFNTTNIPITIIFGISKFDKNKNINILIILFFLILIMYFFIILLKYKKKSEYKSTDQIKISNLQSLNGSYLSNIASYILPLFSLGFDGIKGMIIFGMIYIFTGFLFIKSDEIYSSLIFYLLKYNVYSVEYNDLSKNSKEMGYQTGVLLSTKGKRDILNHNISVRYLSNTNDVELLLIETGEK